MPSERPVPSRPPFQMPVARPGRLPGPRPVALLGIGLLLLTACTEAGNFDPDFRQFGSGFETATAAEQASDARPSPDARGIISYPNYQVAVARRGDTIESIAARTGLPAAELASYNAIPAGTVLRQNEVVALPRRVDAGAGTAVAAGSPSIGGGTISSTGLGGGADIAAIAGGAIDRASGAGAAQAPAALAPASGTQPARHQVAPGETAYSVARLYGVSVKSLADWNGLGADLSVREGQYLLIPTTSAPARATEVAAVSLPGEGSPTPQPPSAGEPLPAATPLPAAEAAATPAPASPDLAADRTAASGTAQLVFPVDGRIIRAYEKKKNEGIAIAAAAGTPVKAAEAGTVAAITRDTEGVPILVLRHADNLLTVYANIDGLSVAKGDKVTRGQAIAKVRASDPAFVHFEVRKGFDSVDPMPYLQ